MKTDRSSTGDGGVVLVHDYLLVLRGAERVFEAMLGCFPDAPVATLLYDRGGTQGRFADREVRTSFLQRLAADQKRFRGFLPLLPMAAERLAIRDARTVISSSSAFALGVRPAPDAVHVCYCHSPFRYVWHERARIEREMPSSARGAMRHVLDALRRWDSAAAARVNGFIANSELTRQRIGDFYGRDSVVVHPPVQLDRFTADPDPGDYFLTVGQVTSHKRTETALAAAEQAGVTLKIVGEGPHLDALRARYPRAQFVGRVDDRELSRIYAGARALVVPAIEEFGITMVEALAAGRPVLAAAAGGALEIVSHGETGVLVDPGDAAAMAEAMRTVDWESFDPDRLRASARRFSPEQFRQRFASALAALVSEAVLEPAFEDAGVLAGARRRAPALTATATTGV
ncbi:MAG: glycosyltransferase [Solirubrobacterales bacterium]|nr:glycosyltransferase [Solirubrobacterales bacterium]